MHPKTRRATDEIKPRQIRLKLFSTFCIKPAPKGSLCILDGMLVCSQLYGKFTLFSWLAMRSSPPREVETRLLKVAKQGVEKVLHPHRHAQENLIEYPCCGESKLRKNQVLESSTESTRRLRQQHIPPKPCILPRGKTGALQKLALTV